MFNPGSAFLSRDESIVEDRQRLVVGARISLCILFAERSHVRGRFRAGRSGCMGYHRSKRNHARCRTVRGTVPGGISWTCRCGARCLSGEEARPTGDRQFTNLSSSIYGRHYERVGVRSSRDGTVRNVSLVNKHNSHFNIHPFARKRGCRAGVRISPSPGASAAQAIRARKLNQCPQFRCSRLAEVGRRGLRFVPQHVDFGWLHRL
jgi:hypothetical protein